MENNCTLGMLFRIRIGKLADALPGPGTIYLSALKPHPMVKL